MRRFLWMTFGGFLLLAGCSHSWDGATTKALFAKWGCPNRIVRMPKGKRILIYKRQCTAWFVVDKKQRIIHTHYKDNDCRVLKFIPCGLPRN